MSKFFGNVGYAETVETSPGVWVEQIIERPYYGDVLRNYRRLEGNTEVNEDISLSNEISIVADPYAYDHYINIRYVILHGVKWKVSSVDAGSFPRLIMQIGGEYHGSDTN